jgi:hypothetical protein
VEWEGSLEIFVRRSEIQGMERACIVPMLMDGVFLSATRAAHPANDFRETRV